MIRKEIRKYAKKDRAKASAWYFKTGKGEYGEGDKFLGLTMGEQRTIAKKYREVDLKDIKTLLSSPYHEERMVGLLILVYKYEKADEKLKKKIFNYYIKNRRAVNNWDLVDVTVPRVVGFYLKDRDKTLLYKYAKSKNLWERRISVLATFPLIKEGKFKDSLALAKILLSDEEDLIHKAVGWMLREIGKKDNKVLEKFLNKNIHQMPRTTLRYSIERLSEKKRKYYMSK